MKLKSIFSLRRWINLLLEQKFAVNMKDETYLKLKYYSVFGKKLNLDDPKTYNEKLQWLKLYDRKPIYTTMVDKFASKEYVAERIGAQHIIPLLGGPWYHFDEIDFDALPEQFVLKTNHDSGGVMVCKDKATFDKEKAKLFFDAHLQRQYFWNHREWPYKDVKPCIFAETYMVDESGYELKDYKFFCFDGKVKALFVAKDRNVDGEETKFDFFDENFNHLPFTNGHPNSEPPYAEPPKFEEMKLLAEKLSTGVPQLRVDFYNINGQIYFGELTFYHWSGLMPFDPEEWDSILGSWIQLNNDETKE